MPGGDRTGPEGRGPGTGRGQGDCNSARPSGRGFRRPSRSFSGYGRGAGRFDEDNARSGSLLATLIDEIRLLRSRIKNVESKKQNSDN